jgi:probable rRNA maturation factor
MSVRVTIGRHVRAPREALRALARALDRAARRAGLDRGERAALGVHVVGDREMARLNREHRGVRGATDVLSFAAAEAPLPADARTLGDVVVDWDEVRRREPSAGGRMHEAAQLGVHGLAHLLGHDHARADESRRMLRCERALARAARLAPPRRPYGSAGRW